MPDNVQTMLHWLHGFLWIAAFCATLFPIIYSFIPWYRTALGRVLMLQAFSLAAALDITLLFQYWHPTSLTFAFWVELIVFGLIAFATTALTVILVRSQVFKRNPTNSYDGTIEVSHQNGKKVYSLNLDSDPQYLDQKDEVVFKVSSLQEDA